MKRTLEQLIEKMARAMCSEQNGCSPNDAFCDQHWQAFHACARRAYDALVEFERSE